MIKNIFKRFCLSLALILVFLHTSGCGIYKKTDTRKVPVNVNDRVAKNIQEGRGFRVFDNKQKNNGVFEFASSNEMWRASINLLDFVPLSNVDYSGGIIITDWFTTEDFKNDSVKLTIKFLSNEIRSDGLNVVMHKKTCSANFNCKIKKLETNLTQEIKAQILKEATMLKENIQSSKPKNKRVFSVDHNK